MTTAEQRLGKAANFVDERIGAAGWVKKSLNKVFPDHWSFMLGEKAKKREIEIFLEVRILLIGSD